MRKVNIAVIGTGHLGSKHTKVYAALPSKVNLVAACDCQPSKAQPISQQYNIQPFLDYKKIPLKTLDAVSICVPTKLHYTVANYFLSHKIHCLIEKPITTTLQQAKHLTALSQKKRITLQVGHVERFNSAFQAIKNIARNARFIECHRLSPFSGRSTDIGVVLDLMIHDIDIILGLAKSKLKNVQAVGVNILTPREDIANARIAFQNGCVCNLTASRVSPEAMRKIRLFLKDTYISLDYVTQEAFMYKKKNNLIVKHALPIEREEPLKKEIESFIDCILRRKKPVVSGKEATDALSLALKIQRLIWKKK
ncbi:Gfo/Idh/MocA family oxidoreductase [Candidatus Omnitrophota bacterium]